MVKKSYAAVLICSVAAIVTCGVGPVGAIFLAGDLNGDNSIDVTDLVLLQQGWLSPSVCSEQGLVGRWKLDESGGATASDSSSYGRAGTLQGNAAWMPDGGNINGAVALDGDGDYVRITGYAGISGSGPRSCAAWIRTAHASGIIVGWGQAGSPAARWLVMLDPAGLVRVEVGGGYVTGKTVLPDNLWHHVAIVSDGTTTDSIRLYVDGRPETRGTLVSQSIATANADDVGIGAFGGTAPYFNGRVDDVRIYDRAWGRRLPYARTSTAMEGSTLLTCRKWPKTGKNVSARW